MPPIASTPEPTHPPRKTRLLDELNDRIARLSQRETQILIGLLALVATVLMVGGPLVVALMRLMGALCIVGAMYLLWRKGDVFQLWGVRNE